MRLTDVLLIGLLPAVAGAQVPMDAVPPPCASLDTMQTQPSGEWQMGADSLMYTPEADTARKYEGTDMWACKRANGEVYLDVGNELWGAIRVSGAIDDAMMRRVSGDRTSPYWVGTYDHPARYIGILMGQRDGPGMHRTFNLPTDTLWTGQ
jgi:hypothetical protein